MANDTVVQAHFALKIYTIAASASICVSIEPAGSVNVNYDANQTFTVTSHEGYSLVDVVVDSVSAGSVTTYTFVNVNADTP